MDPYASFYGIAVDANYVYWSEGTGLYRIDKSGVAATKKQLYAANGGQWYFSVAAASTGSPLAWTVTNTYVGTVGVFNGTSTTYFNESPVWSIALDAKNVYWTTDTGLIRTAPIGGTTAMTIASGQSNANVVHSIASDGTSVFWTSHNDGTILSQPIAQLDGGTSSVIISGEIQPDVLAVDATNLYWCAYPQLRSAPKNGTGTTTTLVQFTSGCLDFAIDATSLYFFDLNGVERVPLGGGPVTTVVDAKAYGGGGNAIAVDATNVYWLAGGPTGTVWKATLK